MLTTSLANTTHVVLQVYGGASHACNCAHSLLYAATVWSRRCHDLSVLLFCCIYLLNKIFNFVSSMLGKLVVHAFRLYVYHVCHLCYDIATIALS